MACSTWTWDLAWTFVLSLSKTSTNEFDDLGRRYLSKYNTKCTKKNAFNFSNWQLLFVSAIARKTLKCQQGKKKRTSPSQKILKEIEFLNSTHNNETTKIINFLLRCTLCCCYCWKKIVVHLWHLVLFWQQLCLCSQTSVELSVNGMKTFVDTNDWLASIFMSNSYHLKQRADKCHKTTTQCDNIYCRIENRY